MKDSESRKTVFRARVLGYYRRHGRDMPWRRTRNPYRILVSEIMLQQTQVSRVMKFYPKFLREFPTMRALARSPLSKILHAWQGLGYNRRALMLKKLAREVMDKHQGTIPADPHLLDDLPGIGPNTAGAVAAFAFDIPTLFIETNIRRAYIHFFFPGKKNVDDREIMRLVGETLDRKNPRQWYYALMDYGAHLAGENVENPNRRSRHYARQSRFEGSDRQIRAGIIRFLLERNQATLRGLSEHFREKPARISRIAASLAREGFMRKIKNEFTIDP